MSFKKWLYRKEIEQLKEDLYLFKMRYEFDTKSFMYTSELTEIRKYLESIIKGDKVTPCERWNLTHKDWVKLSEEEFNSYFDTNLLPPEEPAYSFEELKEKFNNIEKEQKYCVDLGYEIRHLCCEMAKTKKSVFYHTFVVNEGSSFCLGIMDDTSFYPSDPHSHEQSMIKWDAIIRGVEGCLLAFGCTKEELEAV